MTEHYLLPCSCGQKLAVSLRQAGGSVTCPCGNVLEVPPLNRLKTFEPVAPKAELKTGPGAARTYTAWSGRQAGLFLGVVLLCVGIPWAAWLDGRLDVLLPAPLQCNKPRLLPVEKMTPLQTWGMWQELRTGADRYPSPQAQAYTDALSQNRNWFFLALGMSVAGVLVCIGSYTLLKPSPHHHAPEK
jgi:hypothetical protein